MSLMETWKTVRDRAWYAATFWRTHETNAGVRLSIRGASPRVRFVMMKGYELEDARLCRQVLTPEDRVLELGSSVGFVALYCLGQIGVAKLAMVEANPDLPPRIAENFALNGVPLAPLVNVAVGPTDGETVLRLGSVHWRSSTHAGAGGERTITVPQRTIPSIVAGLDFTPNVLVMDIEGAEIHLPPEHFAPFEKIVMEVHPGFVGRAAVDQFCRSIEALGFRLLASDGDSRAYGRGSAH